MRWFSASAAPNRPTGEPAAYLLPAPTAPDALADIAGGEPNLIPFKSTLAPLRIDFAMWLNSAPTTDTPEQLVLYWDDKEVASKTWTAPVAATDLFIMAPLDALKEGLHTLHYRVTTYNGNQAGSQPLALTIDTTPPALVDEGPLQFPAEVITGGVTDRYLKANGDRLLAQVPAYGGMRLGDTLTWYWSRTSVGIEKVGSMTLAASDIGKPVELAIPGTFIRTSRDGIRYAYYTVQDRAQTPVQRALAVALDVAATPIPRNLPPPTIKEASGSTLLPGNALNGVTLVVPAQATVEPDETIEVFWGEPGTPGAYTTSTPVAAGSREYPVPRDNIPPQLGKRMPVTYTVTTWESEALPSRVLQLQVQLPAGLPIVQCDKVAGGRLSLAALQGADAKFTLPSWQFMATSQFVTLVIAGLDTGGNKKTIAVVTEMPVPSAGQPIAVGSVSRTALSALRLNQQIDVKVQVSFDNKLTWVSFPLLKPTLVA
ncbi:hypothetical protein [Pseudomonas reidholzensis]|nr:hypothetical protein [Pseudomonas reidholzensis]